LTYPNSTDYVSAVQDPRALLDPDLRRATFTVDPLLQIPMPASGNSAVVFKAAIEEKSHALRFFIREDASSRERYRSLHAFLVQHRLTDCTAAAEWVDDAILVQRRRWPMVKMQWIEGRTLDAYVDYLVQSGDAGALEALAQAWRQLVLRMQDEGFAHGDLQHGNVLVDTAGKLRLVDFDGSWIMGATGPVPTETGHPNYQLRGRLWGRWMDSFPGLLVYTALRSLALRPSLWKDFSARENILFTKADFIRPFDTPIWSELLALGDAKVTQSISQLRASCAAAGSLTISLESMIGETADKLQEPLTGPLRGLSPLEPGSPWWAQTGQQAAASSSAGSAAATATLPPPPPKSPYEKPKDNGFSTKGARPIWFEPPTTPPASARAGAGPVGRPPPPPGRPPGRPHQPGGPRQPLGQPSPPARRRRRGLWLLVSLIVLILVVVIIIAVQTSSSSSPPYPSATSSAPYSPYQSSSRPTFSPTPEETETVTDATLLLEHVPAAIAVSCTTYEPRSGVEALVAVTCSDPDEPITIRYYRFSSGSEMDDAFASYYSVAESGSCIDGEEGTHSYNEGGEPAGQYSCYDSDSVYHVLTWTHNPTAIMVVALSSSSTYAELLEWADNAGPNA
jgi:hypothetical protein